MKNVEDVLQFPCGKKMKNRFILAPMTNQQSNEDGSLGDQEYNWLEMRAKGGFGMVMTCASHVQMNGKGFRGQLGIYKDDLLAGHKRLSSMIQSYGSLAIIQIFHGGNRAEDRFFEGGRVSSSADEKTGARALTTEEVHTLRDDFIAAAIRAKEAGYDGVEVHGAHGYILGQFLSPTINKRTDEYGSSLENRARLIFEIVDGVRSACGPEFLIAVRLSPERFGMELSEIKVVSQQLIDSEKIDLLDISLWDSFKLPHDEAYQDKTLLQHFEELDFKEVLFTVAGNIKTSADVRNILDTKVDAVSIGKAAILHHDFPNKVISDTSFASVKTPVSSQYLSSEGLGQDFIEYMQKRDGFVDSAPTE